MKIWNFCIAFLVSVSASAQDQQDKIETDRPNESQSPTIVPKGWLQFEAGFRRELNQVGLPLYTLPSLLSKYGVSKKLELRLLTEYASFYHKHLTDTFGLEPVTIGVKYNLLEEKGLRPQTSVVVQTGLNRLASEYYKGYTFFAPEFRFAMEHTLSDKIKLGYNLGAEWEQTNEPATFIYTLVPSFELGEKWQTYIELYGFIQKGELPEHNIDAGFAYTISNNTRADISAGMGLSKDALDHYIAIGFSFRVPASKKAVHL
jgi:hypothetical protein